MSRGHIAFIPCSGGCRAHVDLTHLSCLVLMHQEFQVAVSIGSFVHLLT